MDEQRESERKRKGTVNKICDHLSLLPQRNTVFSLRGSQVMSLHAHKHTQTHTYTQTRRLWITVIQGQGCIFRLQDATIEEKR